MKYIKSSLWDREKTLRLIELLEMKECLWKVQIDDYRNKNKRHDAIQEIGAALQMHHEEIRQKIDRLR